MAQLPMYKAQNDSVPTTLTETLLATATTIAVADVSVFPDAPCVAVIGNETTELIIYNGKEDNILTGVQRGMHGTLAQIWPADTLIARTYTSLDHDTVIANMQDLDTRKLEEDSDGSNVTATFIEAVERELIVSGGTLRELFGRIAKWLSDLRDGAFAAFGTGAGDVARGNHTHGQYLEVETDPTVPQWAKAATPPKTAWVDIPNKPEFAPVSISGEYGDLAGAPALAAVATSGRYEDLAGVPALAGVATSGQYGDLTGIPTIPSQASDINAVGLSDEKAIPGQISASVVEVTGSRPVISTDAGRLLKVLSANDAIITIPSDDLAEMPIDTEIEIVRYGEGAVTIAADVDVILNSPDGAVDIAVQYGAASLKKMASNEWWLEGRLK